jgi:hypothetical protein
MIPITLQPPFDLLLVTPVKSDSHELASILAHSCWVPHWVRTRQEGLEFLLGHASFMAVVCDRDLPDGSWKDLASVLRAVPDPPLLFVACSDPRGLWFDVIQSGLRCCSEAVRARGSHVGAYHRLVSLERSSDAGEGVIKRSPAQCFLVQRTHWRRIATAFAAC